MAIRPILELPHPMLRRRAKKVRKIDSSILRLAHDMVDTMQEANGVGLAANQVGVLQRIIVIQLPEEDPRIYVNPEIVYREGEREVEEGCLSIPGYKGFIKRSLWVKFSALDHTSLLVKLKADGLLSQALEHEVDHLNGILYVDHLESHEMLVKIEPDSEHKDSESNEQHSGNSRDTETEPGPDERDTPASIKIR